MHEDCDIEVYGMLSLGSRAYASRRTYRGLEQSTVRSLRRNVPSSAESEARQMIFITYRLDSLLRSLIGDSRRINRGHPLERRSDYRFIAIHLTSRKSRSSCKSEIETSLVAQIVRGGYLFLINARAGEGGGGARAGPGLAGEKSRN